MRCEGGTASDPHMAFCREPLEVLAAGDSWMFKGFAVMSMSACPPCPCPMTRAARLGSAPK